MASNRFGWNLEEGAATFSLWAPGARKVDLVTRGGQGERAYVMQCEEGGVWRCRLEGALPERYAVKVDDQGPYPDPASRFQPEGVHGFSQIVDPGGFTWHYPSPRLPEAARVSIYELHVGAFSSEGTFEGARKRLPHLRELGVGVIEIMPVAEFPGARNWGYDGVYPFAPSHHYGTPEELAALVDEAHGLGLGVILDVVYNHFGPDGNYIGTYNPFFFDGSKKTPWGDALNFSGARNEGVREFFLSNALYWLREFRFDGLRLDATHAYCDAPEHAFVVELRRAVADAFPDRRILLYAEDERHPARFCHPLEEGGAAFDGIWADDWHHQVRRHCAGDSEGYFAKYDGALRSIALAMENGWEKSEQAALGQPAPPLPYDRFVFCLQNHDQVGNRALGDRLHHQLPPELYRALSALLLLAPETPLLFMGQEWAAETPFLYFTDHEEDLGKKITEGRREEFKAFSLFQDEAARDTIPDPQAEASFSRSKLRWEERAREPHAAMLRFYRALLDLRASHPALAACAAEEFRVEAIEPEGLVMRRRARSEADLASHASHPSLKDAGMPVEGTEAELLVAVWLGDGPGTLTLPVDAPEGVLLTSEAPEMTGGDSRPIRHVHGPLGRLTLEFARAGAWIATRVA